MERKLQIRHSFFLVLVLLSSSHFFSGTVLNTKEYFLAVTLRVEIMEVHYSSDTTLEVTLEDRNSVKINTLASEAWGTISGRSQIPHIMSIPASIKVADKIEGQLRAQLRILLVGLDLESVELGAFIRT